MIIKNAEYSQDQQNRIYLVFEDLGNLLSSQVKCRKEEVLVLQSDGENTHKLNTYSNYSNKIQRYIMF